MGEIRQSRTRMTRLELIRRVEGVNVREAARRMGVSMERLCKLEREYTPTTCPASLREKVEQFHGEPLELLLITIEPDDVLKIAEHRAWRGR